MHIAELEVNGLFGHFNHRVPFPSPAEEEDQPSIVILHGPNGTGKTTVLRMLDGLMRLDFDVFREVPFGRCRLTFSTGQVISVEPQEVNGERPLSVTFADETVLLNPREKGAFQPADADEVERFRQGFFGAREEITFDFITTGRKPAPKPDAHDTLTTLTGEYIVATPATGLRRVRRTRAELNLAERVSRFISEAQVDYRRFFATREPDLFARILRRLDSEEAPRYDPDELIRKLDVVREQDEAQSRLGLEPDKWNHAELQAFLDAYKRGARLPEGLIVLGAYTEVLESRAQERQFIADRLFTFEDVMSEFLLDKQVIIDAKQGLRILTLEDQSLEETQLSSGEFHLLFLMVSSLVTTRRGTVIAIDEPEMSMHIAWQRNLIRSLVKCASRAAPQYVFATHSPDIATGYEDFLVRFGDPTSPE